MPLGRPKKPANQNDFSDLYIGETAEGQSVVLSDKSLLSNGLLVIGTKNTGKSSFLSNFAIQEIVARYENDKGEIATPNSNAGFTFITSRKDHSFLLYAMAKKYHRLNISFLKPSIDLHVKDTLLGMEEFDYDKINSIINYEEAIDKKAIVIIDMENDCYEDASRRAVGMLLLQLQIAMHNTPKTSRRRHYLVIDDAYQYLPYLESILRYGSEYNVPVILFFDSRAQYEEYRAIVDTNIQNILLMSNVTFEDAKYYSEQFFMGSPKELIGKPKDSVYCSFFSDTMELTRQQCVLNKIYFTDKEQKNLESNATKYKSTLVKAGTDNEYISDVMKAYASYTAKEQMLYRTGTIMDTISRVTGESEKETLGDSSVRQPKGDSSETPKNESSGANEEYALLYENPVSVAKSKDEGQIVSEKSAEEVLTIISKTKPVLVSEKEDRNFLKEEGGKLPTYGIRQLLGERQAISKAVNDAPQRIQKQLKEKGIPVEQLKEEAKKNNVDTKEKPMIIPTLPTFSADALPKKKSKANKSNNKSNNKNTSNAGNAGNANNSSLNTTKEPKKSPVKNNTQSIVPKKQDHKEKTKVASKETPSNKPINQPSKNSKINNQSAVKQEISKVASKNAPQQKKNVPDTKQKSTYKYTTRKYTEDTSSSDLEEDFEKNFTSIFDDIKGWDGDEGMEDYMDEFERTMIEMVEKRIAEDSIGEEPKNIPEEAFNDNQRNSTTIDGNDDITNAFKETNNKEAEEQEYIDIFGDFDGDTEDNEQNTVQKLDLRLDLANLSNIPKSSGEHYESFQKSFNEMVHYEGSKKGFFRQRKEIQFVKDKFLK